ncbi:hypothetical protein [Lysobacter gummosus]|jgi:hypothetical protein|uniref:hypothetical protein n=1 Tax=Lysobacter gummosus TaxID=262324 RepID=UPI003641CD76
MAAHQRSAAAAHGGDRRQENISPAGRNFSRRRPSRATRRMAASRHAVFTAIWHGACFDLSANATEIDHAQKPSGANGHRLRNQRS